MMSTVGDSKSDFCAAANPPEKQQQDKSDFKGKTASPITLRLTEDERARLLHLSEGSGMSAYIRKCIFGGDVTRRKKRRSHKPVADRAALAKLLGLLGGSRMANNLNQLAFYANSGSLPVDEDTRNKINEAYAHICVMRTELIKALGLVDRPGQDQ